jgi:hypothetical protein
MAFINGHRILRAGYRAPGLAKRKLNLSNRLCYFKFTILVNNLSPLEAGLRILPFEVAFLAVGPLSGKLADKYNQTQFILTGLVMSTMKLALSPPPANQPLMRYSACTYDLITRIIGAATSSGISSADKALFLASLSNDYLAFAVIRSIAIMPAMIGANLKITKSSEPATAG